MFCTSCGKQIDDNAMFCPYCGVKVLASKSDFETGLSNSSDHNPGSKGYDGGSWDESLSYGGAGSKGGSGYSNGGYSGGSGSGYSSSGYSSGSGGNGYSSSGYSSGSGGNGYSGSGYSSGSGGNGYSSSGYSGSGYDSGSGYGGSGYDSGSGYSNGSGYGGSGYSSGSGYGGSGYDSAGYNSGSGASGNGSGYSSGFGGSGGSGFGGGPDGPDWGSDRSFEKRTDPAKLRGSGTAERMIHLGTGLVGFMPLLGAVLSLLLGILSRLMGMFLWRYYGLYRGFFVVRQILFVACLVVAIGVLIGSLYLVLSGKIGQEQEFIFVLLASFIAIAYFALLILYKLFPVRIVLIIAGLVLGIDLVAKLVTYGTGLCGNFNLSESLNILRSRSVERKARSNAGNTGNAGSAYGNAGGYNNAGGYGSAAAGGAAVYGTLTAADGRSGGYGPGPQGGMPYPGANMGESYFDGTGAELLGNLILTALVSALTCGIATPWFLCRIYRWRKEHTVIDGKRLTFNGTGGELLGKWIIWELLTIITCGLFAFYMNVALKKWELSHTAYWGATEPMGVVYQGSLFDGSFASYLGNSLLCGFLTMITCGIAYPWASVPLLKWQYGGSVVSGDRAGYFGNGTDMFGIYIINGLLSFITCGIYYPWAICRMNRYIYSNVHIIRRG